MATTSYHEVRPEIGRLFSEIVTSDHFDAVIEKQTKLVSTATESEVDKLVLLSRFLLGVASLREKTQILFVLPYFGKHAAEAIDDIRACLHHEVWIIRYYAALACWKITANATAAIPIIVELLASDAADQRIAACGLAIELGDAAEPFRDELLKALRQQ